MNEIGDFGVAGLFVPGEQIFLVGMGGEAADGIDGGIDADFFAEDLDDSGAVDDPPRQRASRGVADEHHAAAPVPQVVFEVMPHPPAGAHAGASHDDSAAVDAVDGHRFRSLPSVVQAGKAERVLALLDQREGTAVEAVGIVLEDFGGRDRHRRVEKDVQPRMDLALLQPLAQKIENLLGALQRKGGNDDIAAPRHRRIDGVVEFPHRGFQLLVQAIAIGGFHHHGVGRRRNIGVAQNGPAAIAEVAGEKHAVTPALLFQLQQNGGRAEDMSGVVEGGANPLGQFHRLAVRHMASKTLETVEHIQRGVQRLHLGGAAVSLPRQFALAVLRLLLLQAGGVEQHQSRQLERWRGADDLTLETALDQQRNASAVVEMGVGQQQVVDAGGIEAEGGRVLFIEFPPALVHAAVDENPLAGAFDHVAGAGDALIGAVE